MSPQTVASSRPPLSSVAVDGDAFDQPEDNGMGADIDRALDAAIEIGHRAGQRRRTRLDTAPLASLKLFPRRNRLREALCQLLLAASQDVDDEITSGLHVRER